MTLIFTHFNIYMYLDIDVKGIPIHYIQKQCRSLSLYILTMVTAWSMSISGPGPGTSITLLGALLDCPPTFIFCWKYNDHTIWGLPSSEVESECKKIPYIFFMVTFHRKVKNYKLIHELIFIKNIQ